MALRSICREMFLDVVLQRAAESGASADGDGRRMALIADDGALRTLGSFLRMADLHAEGVVGMELLSKPREPLPGLDAVYFLAPGAENIDQLLRDFASESQPQHRHVHLCFAGELAADLMAKVAGSKTLAPRVKSLVEIPLSFVMHDKGFHLDMPAALPGFFPIADSQLVRGVARKLADACRCLQSNGRSVLIRYMQSSTQCKTVAESVRDMLAGNTTASANSAALPCQLVVLDRSIDMAAALVHEYTYEAAAYDLLDGEMIDVDKNVVTVPGQPPKEFLLSDADSLWEEMKHMHLQDVGQALTARTSELHQHASGRDASQSTAEILDMLRRLPEQGEFKHKLSLHWSINEQVLAKLEHLTAPSKGLGLLEQDIACGIDKEGKDVKAANLQTALSKLFSGTDHPLSSESRLRLLMLYFACMANITEPVRDKLIDLAQLDTHDQGVLMSMLRTKLMEVPDAQRHRQGTGCVHRVTKDQAARFKRNAKMEGRFELSRFEPRMKDILEQIAAGKLSNSDFPAVGGMDEFTDILRNSGVAVAAAQNGPKAPVLPEGDDWSFAPWSQTQPPAPGQEGAGVAAGNQNAVRQRVVIFVIGGITHSEMRTVAEVGRSVAEVEFILGGTAVLTPRRLIKTLEPPQGAEMKSGLDLT